MRRYARETIKVSFFLDKISEFDFSNEDAVKNLRPRYRGFIVLRPLTPRIIGRSVISPAALKEHNICCRTVSISTTVNSISFTVDGFPHSTQDTETITCAETSLWAIMEYFGNSYVEYVPALPSKIIETLQGVSNERLIPSDGLLVSQIAFALKEFGFGTKIYSYKSCDFHSTLSTYIESGIRLIHSLDNRHKGAIIGHAVICIGHEHVSDDQIDRLAPSVNTSFRTLTQDGVIVYDNDDIKKDFIFVDDNYPVYQRASLDVPCGYYTGFQAAEWKKCDITCFIAPLHSRIYVEAKKAKAFIGEYLKIAFPIPAYSEVFVRVFLASSKSYKEELSLFLKYPADLRNRIIDTSMPKFIWIAELSSKNLKKRGLNDGIIILDATETIHRKCLLIAAYKDIIIYEDHNTLKYTTKAITLQKFKSYDKNLKSF